jgi:hypothetical protein
MLASVVPTLVGPLATAILVGTVAVMIGPLEGLLGDFWGNWLAVMLLAVPTGLALGAGMLGLDLVASRLGMRTPSGAVAWLFGLIAPLPVALAWYLWPPREGHSFVLPILAAVFVVRATAWLVGSLAS